MTRCSSTHRKGFTLLEISIVLVIIGLVVGGVLAGRDLIEAAQIRSTISQLEKYDIAANTFRIKYAGLPGDIINPSRFGLSPAGGSEIRGNGQLDDCHFEAAPGHLRFGCENKIFWNHLTQAALIEEMFNEAIGSTAFADITANIAQHTPKAKVNDNYIVVSSWYGFTYYHITGIGDRLSNACCGSIAATVKLSPRIAMQIDFKSDDGKPTTGKVLANDWQQGSGGLNLHIFLNPGSSSRCRNASNEYNLLSSAANSPLCQLRVKAGF